MRGAERTQRTREEPRLGEVGAQQMQADVGTLKATLLELPTLGQASCRLPAAGWEGSSRPYEKFRAHHARPTLR